MKLHELPNSKSLNYRKAIYYNNYYDIGGFLNGLGAGKGLGSMGSGTGGAVLGAAASAVGGMVGNAISGGMTSGVGSAIDSLSGIASAIPGPWGAVAGAGLKVVGGLANAAFGSKINQEAVDNLKKENAAQNNFKVDNSSNDALLNSASNFNMLGNIDTSTVGKDGWFANKAKKLAAQLNAERQLSNVRAVQSMNLAADNLDEKNDLNVAANYAAYGGMMPSIQYMLGDNFNPSIKYAFGGTMNGSIFPDGLMEIDNGGTHESNPNGGIPISMDEEGKHNLVEEGETVWNDFVFSNRLKPAEAELLKYNLDSKYANKTYADISKKLTEEYKESPNDPILKRTTNKLLSSLAAIQEEQKALESSLEKSEESVNKFAKGGSMDKAAYAVNFFKEKGLSEHAAKGLVGNLLRESGLNTGAVNGSSKAFGIAQWLGSRKKALFSKYGNSPSFENQLDFVWHELNTTHKNGLKHLQNSKSVEEAAKNAFGYYEFSSGPEGAIRAMNKSGQNGLAAIAKGVNYALGINGKAGNYKPSDFQNMMGSSSPTSVSLPQLDNANYSLPEIKNTFDFNAFNPVALNLSSDPITIDTTVKDNSNVDPLQLYNMLQGSSTQFSNPYLAPLAAMNNMYKDGGKIKKVGSFKSGTLGDNWTKYTQQGLLDFFKSVETNLANAKTDNERYDIRMKALNDFNKMQRSYYNSKAYELQPTNPYSKEIEKHQSLFNDLGGNKYFNGISDNIYLPKGANTSDKADTWVDGYNGPRTNIRNGGTTEYGDIFSTMTNAASRAGLTYSPDQYLNYGKGNMLNTLGLAPNIPFNTMLGSVDNIQAPDLSKLKKQPINNIKPATNDTEYKPLPTWMRYAPVVGAGLSVVSDLLGLSNKPDYSAVGKIEALANKGNYMPVNPTPIGNYLEYDPLDYNYGLNLLHSQAGSTRNAIRNNANGNQGITNAALLAADYNTGIQEGNLFRQGLEYNDALQKQVEEFNRGTDQYNSSNNLQAQMANQQAFASLRNFQLQGLGQAAAMRDAIDARISAAKSANLTNLFNNIGNIGIDNFNRNQANSIFDYISGGRGQTIYRGGKK